MKQENYHFIGIGGIGMSGLAKILLSQNISVSGSDVASNSMIESLKREGAHIHQGHRPENVPLHSKVVYTSDIAEDNPEYQLALQHNLPLLHRSDLLAACVHQTRGLAVAGTHGKTTTSALLATVLVEAGLDPSFAIGGVVPSLSRHAHLGKGELFAFEADESDRTFLKYHPFGAIITNIDNDHLSAYQGQFPFLIQSFQQFMSQVSSSHHLFWCRDDTHLAQLKVPGQSYGFHPDSQWKIMEMRQEGFSMVFDLEHEGKCYRDIELALIGKHNVRNATAVMGLCLALGIEEVMIRRAFKGFKGVLRRCEKKGEWGEMLFLDDYAHHPTEIETTLQAIRQAIGKRRLIAVFQPHRYTRTRDCLGLYGQVFHEADEVFLTDIVAAGEQPIVGISSHLIQKEIEELLKKTCHYFARDQLAQGVSQRVQKGDVVVTLGAGNVTQVGGEVLNMLSAKDKSEPTFQNHYER